MNINYNNINELINLLHEFVYESKNDTYNNYTYQSLNPSTIKINQLVNNEINNNSILELLDNFKLKFINSVTNLKNINEYKKVICECKINKNFNSIIIIQKEKDEYKDTVNIIDINYEFFMNTIISEYVIIDKIPFFLLNLANYKIPYQITK